ncbi:MAG: CDP-diacylglycerol--glycerol-3-phosphate 3-phosphatidyltransferase [Actinobacteria bacterium RBG_19FT_COMBO_54_7]|uniref:CDP-diacylglycerol--glycerol-3-phosphate 3-phosphatidyltransferase n=1 Tax=Candidatus Solincola sediminis TaxID=1797199 RepID=A0A1F2WGG5_9ACTN|nr:MAG: CDP-diacylglycerol--glycerol-3-phosphate 3-phosphatidyltransferase [Candidatus Solincola sediminis]OFW56227.1 MAG: CDP-diacylglycerol--glycerol-3-phosphate 3-phosphatidyltransferase [Candidatus Solincola sediminis]OFW67925.1 MAG: CDP-diacylglycerol--glycerol-3-phosphate 3-phosphatidyltransferase [Actinobacteria bacterium RBG_19FT_COMBO_54_7]
MIKRNVANFFTCLRIILIPLIIWLISVSSATRLDAAHAWALGVFLFAASTDFIDGQIARRTHTISEFGKLVDPLADRLLVISVLIALMVRQFIPIWMGVVIVGRDVLILLGAPIVGINDKAVREKLAVHWTGKLATALLFTSICIFILWNLADSSLAFFDRVNPIGFVIFMIGIVFSYLSGYIYVSRGIKLLKRREEVTNGLADDS